MATEGFPDARGVRREMAVGDFRVHWVSGGNGSGRIPGTMGVRRKEMAAEKYETHGDLRAMKINGNTSGMMDGDIGKLDETMNNKRKWVWGC